MVGINDSVRCERAQRKSHCNWWRFLVAASGLLGGQLHAADITFTDASAQLGAMPVELSFGAAWGELDGDGWPDLFLSNHYRSPVVLQNLGGRSFANVTTSSPLATKMDHHTCRWADFDLDQDSDMFCSTGANFGTTPTPSKFMVADGRGGFTNRAVEFGVDFPEARGRTISWIDIDGDRDLDLFYGTYREKAAEPQSRLYRNDGAYFTNITPRDVWGLDGRVAHSISSDLDDDGDQDILLSFTELSVGSGPCSSCLILLSNDGRGNFVATPGPTVGLGGGWQHALAAGDIDNDGDLDVFQGNKKSAALHRRNQDGTYSNISLSSVGMGNVLASEIRDAGWFDFNNDGFLDLYVVRGITDSPSNAPNALFVSNGNGTYTEKALAYGAQGLTAGQGDAFAVADYDANGFLDLLIANGYESSQGSYQLLRNRGNTNHWLRVLVTDGDGVALYGTKVAVFAGGRWQYRELTDQAGPRSSNEQVLHFGLGQASSVSTVRVEWPDGSVAEFYSVPIDAVVELRQAQEPPPQAGAFLQGLDGLVSIEAENFSIAESWLSQASSGASGGTGIRSETGVRTSLNPARRSEYPVRFSRVGPHYVWLRMRALSTAGDELRVGLGEGPTYWGGINSFGSWKWIKVLTGPVNVGSVGVELLKLFRIEGDVEVDKIVLTPDNSYQPIGYGPTESAQDLGSSPPVAPVLLATVVSATQVDLGWADVADESGYQLWRDGVEVAGLGANVTSYRDTGLVAGTDYVYQLRAWNDQGESNWSTVRVTMPPVAPAGLAASVVGWSAVAVSWLDVEGEAGYELERALGGGSFGVVVTLGAGVTEYADTGLAGSTTYRYRIRARNAGGVSGYSGEASVVTPAPPPVAPVLLATVVSATQVDLGWADVADESGYQLWRDGVEVAGLGANVTSYRDTGLVARTDYVYQLRAWNDQGESNWSTARVTTPDLLPGAPFDVVASAFGSTVSITWSAGAPTTQDTFDLIRETLNKQGKWSSPTVLPSVGADELSATDQPGLGTFRYSLAASNEVGTSTRTYSNAVSVTDGGGGGCKGRTCKR